MIEHLLACKGIVRNTPREFHNVMHALQLQGAPQVFGRGFGGELYAAAGPLQNNNAAPAVAGVLAFLEQRLAQVGQRARVRRLQRQRRPVVRLCGDVVIFLIKSERRVFLF